MAVGRAGQTVPAAVGLVETCHALQAVSGLPGALLTIGCAGLADPTLQEIIIPTGQAEGEADAHLAAGRAWIASIGVGVEVLADGTLLTGAIRAVQTQWNVADLADLSTGIVEIARQALGALVLVADHTGLGALDALALGAQVVHELALGAQGGVAIGAQHAGLAEVDLEPTVDALGAQQAEALDAGVAQGDRLAGQAGLHAQAAGLVELVVAGEAAQAECTRQAGGAVSPAWRAHPRGTEVAGLALHAGATAGAVDAVGAAGGAQACLHEITRQALAAGGAVGALLAAGRAGEALGDVGVDVEALLAQGTGLRGGAQHALALVAGVGQHAQVRGGDQSVPGLAG